jgi:putative flippase GtrA
LRHANIKLIFPHTNMTTSIGAQFTRFAMAGGAGTVVHYLVLVGLVSLAGIAPGRAAFAGAAVGACAIYLLNRRYTFASSRSHTQTLPRFALMAAAGAVLNGVLVGLLSGAGVYFLLAQVMATGVILVINFIVSKVWIFR